MKSRTIKFFALLVIPSLIASACGLGGSNNPNNDGAAVGITPGKVPVITTSVPDPAEAAAEYLNSWVNEEYPLMYNQLTSLSRDSIAYEDFLRVYQGVMLEGNLVDVQYEILQTLTNPNSAQVSYRINLTSSLIGEIVRETLMNLTLENNNWRVIWDSSLILPELNGENYIDMLPDTPTRGIIYDREGNPLAAFANAVALSVIPSAIGVGEEEVDEVAGGLLAQLATLTGIPPGYFEGEIFVEDPDFLVPIGVISSDQFESRSPFLGDYSNMLSWTEYFTRLYYGGSGGANAIGFLGPIPVEDSDFWIEKGYPIDAQIGRTGLEAWGEPYLAGKRGGQLFVISADGVRESLLGRRDAEPSSSIYTTLDANLQTQAQLAIKDFTGAIVVLERDSGRILAMASSPTFNPNSADPNNPIRDWDTYLPEDRVFFNRATQGQYPPGSIFKVISMAAALESGLYLPQSSIFCGHTWSDGGMELTDWTLDKGFPASGELTLQQGIMRSCNPWFYTIGYNLYGNGDTNLIAEIGRGFGLGSSTGLGILPEAEGLITDPDNSTTGSAPVFNAVQQAIGQSDTLITPIQAAAYIAAVGNGGTLYQPQMIEYIEDISGETTLNFEPISNGSLPVSAENLTAIQSALRMVTNNARGTAYRTFANLSIPVFGKTGTASTGGLNEDPHAWFIGYTNANRADKSDIAIAVLVENIGDGSEFAAPIFRRVMEVYFFGSPQRRYPWELKIGVFNNEYFSPPEETEETDETNGGDGLN